jgi:hypothetical protein
MRRFAMVGRRQTGPWHNRTFLIPTLSAIWLQIAIVFFQVFCDSRHLEDLGCNPKNPAMDKGRIVMSQAISPGAARLGYACIDLLNAVN